MMRLQLTTFQGALLFLAIILLIGVIIATPFVVKYVKSNIYPNATYTIDVTNKRIGDANDALDYFLINYGKEDIYKHIEVINKWKKTKIALAAGNKKKIDKLKKR